MKNVRNILLTLILSVVAMTLLVVIVFETGVACDGLLAGVDNRSEFAVVMFMELLTIGVIPRALRLFRFRKIEQQLKQHHGEALKKWGVVRLLLIGVPMLVNTLLYYIYLNTSFGYLAIILALCLPFVWPTAERCEKEAFTHQQSQEQ